MKKQCDCYREHVECKYSRDGHYYDTLCGECYGTKERDRCLCNGDVSKCDFYPEKRAQVNRQPPEIDQQEALALSTLAEIREIIDNEWGCDPQYFVGSENFSEHRAAVMSCKILEKIDQTFKSIGCSGEESYT